MITFTVRLTSSGMLAYHACHTTPIAPMSLFDAKIWSRCNNGGHQHLVLLLQQLNADQALEAKTSLSASLFFFA
jgi:hypothetical protein